MPNWCHDTLTVRGEADELKAFVERARPPLESFREHYDGWGKQYPDVERPPFEEWARTMQEGQPLSFESHVPQPPYEELQKGQTYRTCRLCGGTGARPRTIREAEAISRQDGCIMPEAVADFGADAKTHQPGGCNGCIREHEDGERYADGQERANDPWWDWVLENWGTKWDASFSEPFMALGSETVDVVATVEAKGITSAWDAGVVIYKFDTPWGPPVPWLLTASSMHPELEFELRYGEAGHGFAGQVKVVNGVTIEDEKLEIEDVLAPEEMWF